MKQQLREKLAHEIADWRHRALIDSSLAEILGRRYDRAGSVYMLLLRWLGFFALFMLGSAVLTFIGMFADSVSPFVSAFLLGIVAVAVWYTGSRMASDPAQKYPFTGSILLTLGLIAGYGTLSVFYLAGGGTQYSDIFPLFMIITGSAALATAYQYRLRWPLLVALLFFFHGIGSWHAYGGHGAYFAHIQEERSMAVIALLAVVFGWWHEQMLETGKLRRHLGFGSLYIVFGLLYLNLSLWFLTLPRGNLTWVLAFTAACIGQIIAGARLKDARFTGFGIVFLSIDLYTRFFEHFWDRLSAGTLFLIAGAIGMGLGYTFERLAHKAATEGPSAEEKP